MTPDRDPLVEGIRRRQARSRRATQPSVARHLAQVGVLGWIIVTPMLAGVFAGRWLDAWRQAGLFWTAPLLLLGAGLGCWSAWKWTRSA